MKSSHDVFASLPSNIAAGPAGGLARPGSCRLKWRRFPKVRSPPFTCCMTRTAVIAVHNSMGVSDLVTMTFKRLARCSIAALNLNPDQLYYVPNLVCPASAL